MPKVSGLKPLKYDPRDYSYHKTFGGSLTYSLPLEFKVADPLKIKNQIDSDLCTAFAGTEVAEDIDAILFSPEWLFAQIKRLQGSLAGYGADLRDPMKTGCKVGFLPQTNALFTLANQTRDFVADYKNWPADLENIAARYKKASFFRIQDFYNDFFDSIRVTIYNNRASRESALTGSDWYAEWNGAADGIIPKNYSAKVAQHCFKVFGWKQINGEPHLIVQNSEGEAAGDKGIFYFPREVVNKEFKYGAFCFSKDAEKPVAVNAIFGFIFNIFKNLWPH